MRCFLAAVALLFPLAAAADEPRPEWKRLPAVKHPENNPATEAKIALGKQLFFDGRLSRTGKVSCATCHVSSQGWSNGKRVATGVEGRQGTRNAPTLINVAYNQRFFWDGRAASLEEQALKPIENPLEMDMPLPTLAKKLSQVERYRGQFRQVFGTGVTAAGIAQAIAAYERTLISRDAPLDRFLAGERNALAPAARRGLQLFYGEARCHLCHSGPNLSDQQFHNIGVGLDREKPDLGRGQVSGNPADRGKFKTPTLREVARTAPYMHDGSFQTLTDVVQHYNFGGVTDVENPHRDEKLQVLYLSEEQVADLVAFLKEGLSGREYPQHQSPALPK